MATKSPATPKIAPPPPPSALPAPTPIQSAPPAPSSPEVTRPPQSPPRPVPPPADLPKGPPRRGRMVEPIQPAAPQPPPSKWRELSANPDERAAQRLTVRAEAEGILGMLDGLAQGLPPKSPLAKWERDSIQPPLEETLYKYGGNMDPAFSLALALGAVAFMRWQAWKREAISVEAKP